mmetsp:Transcript_34887/g.96346  ORF Transcript_34887/g.96346 Transcript_34887/m.96346 type:complete len:737 (-) Transcript_34887:487-2697(-)
MSTASMPGRKMSTASMPGRKMSTLSMPDLAPRGTGASEPRGRLWTVALTALQNRGLSELVAQKRKLQGRRCSLPSGERRFSLTGRRLSVDGAPGATADQHDLEPLLTVHTTGPVPLGRLWALARSSLRRMSTEFAAAPSLPGAAPASSSSRRLCGHVPGRKFSIEGLPDACTSSGRKKCGHVPGRKFSIDGVPDAPSATSSCRKLSGHVSGRKCSIEIVPDAPSSPTSSSPTSPFVEKNSAQGSSGRRMSLQSSSDMAASAHRSPLGIFANLPSISPSGRRSSNCSQLNDRGSFAHERDSWLRRPSSCMDTSEAGNLRLSGDEHYDPNSASSATVTDAYYAATLAVRSMPVSAFMSRAVGDYPLPITSINEDRLLLELGLDHEERSQLEGLKVSQKSSARSGSESGLNEERQAARAIVRLAANPPEGVGRLQRRTARWLLRPFPHGARTSGKNMSPLPGWLSGAQSVALNMSKPDLPVQLHFALFKGSAGYVLKPPVMLDTDQSIRTSNPVSSSRRKSRLQGAVAKLMSQTDGAKMAYWPPPRKTLRCTTVEILSLHCLPTRRERRPRFDGSRSDCHRFEPALSGTSAPPTRHEARSPSITLSLHPIGGFCAVSTTLPVPMTPETDTMITSADGQSSRRGGGLNLRFNKIVHCVAAEPEATFMRVGVTDGGLEVAYETCVLGRVLRGFRIFQLRSMLGTRIELAYVFVRISFRSEPNLWLTRRQLRVLHAMEDSAS